MSCIGLLSCDASPIEQVSQPILDIALPNRQILAVDDNPLQIDIVVNNGQNQRFDIPPGQNTFNIPVAGIRQGEPSRIQITWTEILNEHPIILALQDQQFSSSGNIVVDTEHQWRQFDGDGDGVSNLEERNNGTCVWYANNECLTDGGLDVPPDLESRPPRVTENDVWIHQGYSRSGTKVTSDQIGNGIATIRDLDFSDGVGRWESSDGATSIENNTLCIPLKNGQVGFQDNVGWYNDPIPLEPGSYVAQFDVRVNRLAPVAIGITPILEHYIQATNEWETHSILFENDTQRSVTIGFMAIRSAFETTYCFDNIKLVKI